VVAGVDDEDEHHAKGEFDHQAGGRRRTVRDQWLAACDEDGEGDYGDEGGEPSEHVADALNGPALRREQQDHPGQRDGLQSDDEPYEEEVKQRRQGLNGYDSPYGRGDPLRTDGRRPERLSFPLPNSGCFGHRPDRS
jgi:hypothetical protein